MSFTCFFLLLIFVENHYSMLFLHRIFNSVWMIDRDYAMNYLPLVSSYIKGERTSLDKKKESIINSNTGVLFVEKQNGGYHISDSGRYASPEEAPEGSIAVITISGAITKHDQNCGPAGMATKAAILKRCYANNNIKGIIIDQDTGGGEGGAMRLFNEAVSMRNKPVIGFVNDFSCSAGMGNLSACDRIVANSSLARVGSIGTYMTIADYTEYFEKQGINLIEVYATASTDKNKEYHEAMKGNHEPLRAIADKFNESFIEMIEEQRGDVLKADRKVWGTGKVFFAEEALALGLIDEINSFDNVLKYF